LKEECSVIAYFSAQCLHKALCMNMGLQLWSQHHPEGVTPRDKSREREIIRQSDQLT